MIAIRGGYPARLATGAASQRFTILASFAALSVYALLLFGAQVRGSGASLVFPDWPLFDGRLIPAFSTDPTLAGLQAAQFLHRVVAVVVGIIVLVTAWVAWRRYPRGRWGAPGAQPTLLLLTGSAAALFLIQMVVGALQITTTLASWAVTLHVALGAAIWALLLAPAVYAYCEARRTIPATTPPGPAAPDDPNARTGAPEHPDPRLEPVSRMTRARAYVALTKPRIIELLLITTVRP